ncbi:MAG: diguanylate cyclase, partial [Planctomycetes bacterium]|nr:diguanylate cyclase [Planctomycetota bacterium]
ADRLMDFLGELRPRIEEVSGILSIDVSDLKDLLDLMASANEHLLDLAIREQASLTHASTQKHLAELEAHRLQQKNQQLQKQTIRDSLTGAYTRRFFEESLKNEVLNCCRTATGVGVIFADIDHFKRLNDQYGHLYGDRVLRRTCELFEKCLRKSDILARYGGEEFVIMIHGSTEKGLGLIAERMRVAIEAEPFAFKGEPVKVTISIGSAYSIPRRKEIDLEQRLVATADEAMYEAKRSGRNRWFARTLTSEAESRLSEMITANLFSRWLVRRKIFDVQTISQAIIRCRTVHVRVGELAVSWKVLSHADVDRICDTQNRGSDRFGETAIRLGLLSDNQLAWLLALQREDPTSLSQAVAQTGLLGESEMHALRDQYLAEVAETISETHEFASV